MTEAQIEAVARAICASEGENPNIPTPANEIADFVWQYYSASARAAIAAYLEVLTKDPAIIKRVGDAIHQMTILNMEHGPIGYDVIAEAALSALKGETE